MAEEAPIIESVAHSRRNSRFASVLLGLLALVAAAALLPLIILPLPWKEQAIFGALLIVLAIFLSMTSRSIAVTILLMTISVFSTLRYGYWRVIQTWEGITSASHFTPGGTADVLLLFAAAFFAFSTMIPGYFH